MPDTYDEYTQAAERDPAPGALRAHIEAQGAIKALRALADDLRAEADRIEEGAR